MPNTSFCRDYWKSLLNALSCVYLYQKVSGDEFEYQIRYHIFPDAIRKARYAYYRYDSLPRIPFGLLGDEVDELFSKLLMSGEYLDDCCSQVIDNYCVEATPKPFRLL